MRREEKETLTAQVWEELQDDDRKRMGGGIEKWDHHRPLPFDSQPGPCVAAVFCSTFWIDWVGLYGP
jgi:hypothetical protein